MNFYITSDKTLAGQGRASLADDAAAAAAAAAAVACIVTNSADATHASA